MATIQSYPMRVATGNSSATTYMPGVIDDADTWAVSHNHVVCRAAGVAKNLIVKLSSAPGSGKAIGYVLQVNGVDSALSLSVADLATTGTSTGSVSIAVGDTLKWKRTLTNTPTISAMLMTWEFHHTVDNKNVHMGVTSMSTGSVLRSGVFRSGEAQAAVSNVRSQLVAAPGTLTELDYTLTAAPGSGKSYTAVLLKNDVVQDGSGGTTNTTVTIADLATTGRWTGSMAMTTSDRLCIQYTPSGTPAGASMTICALYTPDVDGESNLVGVPSLNLPTSSTTYFVPAQDSISTSSATETAVEQLMGVSDFELRDFRVRLHTTVTTGPIDFNTRKNNGATSITVQLTTGGQSGTDTSNTASYISGDTFTMQFVVTGTPGLARQCVYSWVQFGQSAPQIVGALVAGVNTTVTATRAIAFGLDEATSNLHNETGKFKVFGQASVTEYFELEESSAPAGVANKGRIWVEDNGAGKTRLMVQFGSGAAQQIAIEP